MSQIEVVAALQGGMRRKPDYILRKVLVSKLYPINVIEQSSFYATMATPPSPNIEQITFGATLTATLESRLFEYSSTHDTYNASADFSLSMTIIANKEKEITQIDNYNASADFELTLSRYTVQRIDTVAEDNYNASADFTLSITIS